MERRREEEEMPPPSNLPPAGTLDGLERMRNPGMPHVNTVPRAGPDLPAESCVVF